MMDVLTMRQPVATRQQVLDPQQSWKPLSSSHPQVPFQVRSIPVLRMAASAGSCVCAAAALVFHTRGRGIKSASSRPNHDVRYRQAFQARQLCSGRAAAGGMSDGYLTLEVETPEGSTVRVEARRADTVRVVKAMIQLKTGVSEDRQILRACANAEILQDDTVLESLGVLDNEKFSVEWVTDLAIEAGEPDDEEELDKSMIKLVIRCDERPGKPTRVNVVVSNRARISEVKAKALQCLSPEIRKLGPKEYGLFIIPEDYTTNATAAYTGLRFLTKDERLAEKSTVEECKLTGEEEITLASLYFYDKYA
mmetsp:Transcript_35955/g.66037  ORF Transcript_35955/g.66037 Transcript_35955/m.66037 type:complete len:308 (+) Transcript_35955:44-967(+)